MSDLDPYVAIRGADGKGLAVDADRRARRPAGTKVELGVVSGGFDNAVRDPPVAEVRMFLAAAAVQGVKGIIRAADDHKGLRSVVRADQVFGVDVVGALAVMALQRVDPFHRLRARKERPVQSRL